MSADLPGPGGDRELPPRLVRDLYAHQIAPEAVVALGLYPLIHVAWADGRIQAAERELVVSQVAAAGFAEPARKLIARWLAHPPQQPEALLDLAWQLVDRLPPPLQRMAAQDAARLALAVAMAAGPKATPVEPSEEAALAEVVAALGGNSAQTAQREALLFGLEVETRIPGYQSVAPTRRLLTKAIDGDLDMDACLDFLVHPGDRFRVHTWRPPSGRRRLFDLVARAHRQAPDEVLDEFGFGGRFGGLDAWQVCRFIVWLICQGATYDPAFKAAASGEEAMPKDDKDAGWLEENVKRLKPSRDHISSLELLRGVLDDDDIPFICRDYTRLAVELYEACRTHLSACRWARLIPVLGNHDLRSFAGHAWCLFLDTHSRAAVALDPTAADSLWDAGWADGPFNDLLDARGLCTASIVMTRLIEEPVLAAGRAASSMIGALPAEQRPWLVARTIAQGLTAMDLHRSELGLLMSAVRACGLPSGFTDRVEQRVDIYAAQAGEHGPEMDDPFRRGRVAALVCEGGVLEEVDLPSRLAEHLADYRTWVRSRQAKRAKVGRNDPCPCGSGKKYKKCCGRRD